MKKPTITFTPTMRAELEQFIANRVIDVILQDHFTAPANCQVRITNPNGTPAQSLNDCLAAYQIQNRDDIDVQKNFAIASLLGADADLRLGQKVADAVVNLMHDHIRILDETYASDDPYYRNIGITDRHAGRFRLGLETFEPCELTPYSTPNVERHGVAVPNICLFKNRFVYPILREGPRAWMTVSPTEITTMREPIRAASGHVLTLGCGLGYYAYMVHLKPNVESVTIVERSPDVITTFETAILPQFDHPEKIHVIQADAFDYISNLADGEFDHCFADIWESCADVDLYLRTKMAARRFTRTKFTYWIEDGIIATIISSLASVLVKNIQDEIPVSRILAVHLDELPPDQRRATRLVADILFDQPIDTPKRLREILTIRAVQNAIEHESFKYKSP